MNKLGIEVPSILLPRSGNLSKWPVIACDQFTQDRDYWEKVKTAAAGVPSTLNLIFPEVFLADDDASKRIEDIQCAMKNYLQSGVFAEAKHGFIYIERDTPYQKKRRGLIAVLDLEQYDWHPEARPLIRCTEGTVPERLPPRMDIRRGAPLELPHVLVLIDDDTNSLLPALGEKVKRTSPVYDTPLMMDSGHVTGWLADQESDIAFVNEKLEDLYNRSVNRYSVSGGKPFLYAVGDGNHSLATALGIWNELKKNGAKPSHPCRYALVEIENIYDSAIEFEPIHRVVFDINFDDAVSLLSKLPDYSCRKIESADELTRLCKNNSAANCFGIISQGRYALIETSAAGIATACLQPLLDNFAKDNPQLIDYIHDEEEVFRLAENKSKLAAGILLPPVQKSGLFETVARIGPLPRKSFSMGHSAEKRFYLECRALIS
ncbi:MAG: DUF1015 domain-containing protein [Treponema sp.]|nr:DUF1015 domain-containing protein [Treponema sp.]